MKCILIGVVLFSLFNIFCISVLVLDGVFKLFDIVIILSGFCSKVDIRKVLKCCILEWVYLFNI